MPLFRDLDGNHYDIPDDDLKRYQVKGEVGEDAQLRGTQTAAGPAGFDPGGPRYLWPPIDVLHQVVANIVSSLNTQRGGAAALDPRVYNWAPDQFPPSPRPYNYDLPRAYNYVPPRAYNYASDARSYNYPDAQRSYNYPDTQGGAYNYPGQNAAYNYEPPQGGGGRRS